MFRRSFIDYLIRLGSSLMFLPVTLSAESPKAQDGYNNTLTIIRDGIRKKIRYFKQNNIIYLSLVDFANVNNYGIFTNTNRRKTVLYVDRDKIKFTAENVFVVLNDGVVQMTREPLWQQAELWVPAHNMARLFEEHTAHKMSFDAQRLEFSIDRKNVNISNFNITVKDNGTLIQLFSTKKFDDRDITLKSANGWLHVDIFGGKVDVDALSRKTNVGIINEVRAVQFEQMVSIAFKLRKPEQSREVILPEDSNDILINLRTKEFIEDEDQVENELDKQKNEWLVHTIIIDAGHGGKDGGAPGYGNLVEKEIVLPVALKLGEVIKKNMPEVHVDYTRKTDVFIPLWKRPKIANEKNGKLFISLHCNSAKDRRASGFETYFLSAENDGRARDVVLKENSAIRFEGQGDKQRYEGINFILATMAQNAFIKQSQYLATVIQKSMAKTLKPMGMKDRGVKQAGFYVMVGATMPNVLVEMGFISNKNEARLLKQKSTQTKIAQAIYEGIKNYKTDIENAR